MSDNLYYLAFSHFLPIGPMRFIKLIEHFGSVKKAYEGNIPEIAMIIGQERAKKFVSFRSNFDPVKKREELEKKEIFFLTQIDTSFPLSLKQIPDPPICIYIKGNNSLDFNKGLYLGIVGTRKPTSYGEQIAKKLSSELSIFGIITVSGLAMGIDGIVHRSTLEVHGKTIAILGCGVDIKYPSCNSFLYDDIIQCKGLIISEFPPGQRTLPGLFILRNRLISGLSKGILVIEGMKDSGTLITAKYAAEQGKEVFAVPSPITSPLSEAPNMLLKQGAKLVTCVEDVFEELGLEIETKSSQAINLNNDEKNIYHLLKNEPLSVDELEIKLHISISGVLQILSNLEIKKVIEKNSESKYQIIIYR